MFGPTQNESSDVCGPYSDVRIYEWWLNRDVVKIESLLDIDFGPSRCLSQIVAIRIPPVGTRGVVACSDPGWKRTSRTCEWRDARFLPSTMFGFDFAATLPPE